MKNLLQGDSNPDPHNQLELKVIAPIHWTTSVNKDRLFWFKRGIVSSSMVIDSLQG